MSSLIRQNGLMAGELAEVAKALPRSEAAKDERPNEIVKYFEAWMDELWMDDGDRAKVMGWLGR